MKKMNTLCTFAVAVALSVSPLATTMAHATGLESNLTSDVLNTTSNSNHTSVVQSPSGDASWATYYGMGVGAATFGLGYYRANVWSGAGYVLSGAGYVLSGAGTLAKVVTGVLVSKPALALAGAVVFVVFLKVGTKTYSDTSGLSFLPKFLVASYDTSKETASKIQDIWNSTATSGQAYVATPFNEYVLKPIGSASMSVINDIANHPVDFTVAAIETFGALSLGSAYLKHLNRIMQNHERNAIIKWVSTPVLNQAVGFAFAAIFFQHIHNIRNFIRTSVESTMPEVKTYVESMEPSTWFNRTVAYVTSFVSEKTT